MKHIFLFTLLACIGLFASCTDEAAINPGGNPGNEIEVPEGMSALKLTFTAPGKAKSYSTLQQTGTELENRIDSISIFLFDHEKNDTLVNVYTVPNPAANADTVVLVAEKSKEVYLIAIANPADSLVTNDWLPYINVIDLADFEKLTTLQHDSMPRPSFIMTAYNKGNNTVDLSGNTAASAEFELTRLVARVDILNRDSIFTTGTEQKHKFELLRARMVNIPSQAYLLPAPSRTGAPFTSKKLTNLYWVNIDTSDDSEGKMESQLYMYPAGNGTDDSGVSLEIEGKYNGVDARYSIPFDSRQIQANHRYIVTLDSINPVEVKFSITMVDWETDTVSFNPDNGGTPTVTLGTLPTGLTNVTGSTGIDTIRFNGFQTAVIPFSVESPIVEPVFSTDANWITVTKETSTKTYADVVFKKSYEITVAQNPDVAREALIHFVNPAKPTERVTYCITQTISNNPLAKFAKANLMVDGTIGVDLHPGNAGIAANYGAWFQWGRNRAFENKNVQIDTVPTRIPFANGTNSTDFIGGNGVTVWHTEAGTTADTWYKLTNSAYTNTDPCPTGYRLPTGNDWIEVLPPNSIVGIYANTSSIQISNSGNITEHPNSQITIGTGPGKYVGNGSNALYGVKNAETDSAYVLRWSYIGTRINPGTSLTAGDTYLQIDCITGVGASFVIVDASSFDKFNWETEAVTRYFPIAGYRHYLNAAAAGRGSYGRYWSSSAENNERGWGVNLADIASYLFADSRARSLSVRCITND